MSLAKTARVLAKLHVELAELDPALAEQVLPILKHAATPESQLVGQILRIISDKVPEVADGIGEDNLDSAIKVVMRVKDLLEIGGEPSRREAVRVLTQLNDLELNLAVWRGSDDPQYVRLLGLVQKLTDLLSLSAGSAAAKTTAPGTTPAAKIPPEEREARAEAAKARFGNLIERIDAMQSDAQDIADMGHEKEALAFVNAVGQNAALLSLLSKESWFTKRDRVERFLEPIEKLLDKAEPAVKAFEDRLDAMVKID